MPLACKFNNKKQHQLGLHWEIPDDWSLRDAASVPVAYGTAYLSLVMRANIQPGKHRFFLSIEFQVVL